MPKTEYGYQTEGVVCDSYAEMAFATVRVFRFVFCCLPKPIPSLTVQIIIFKTF